MRIKTTFLIITLFFLLLFLRLANLQIMHGKVYRSLSQRNCIRLLPQEGIRGAILDSEERIIADSSLAYDLMVLADIKEIPEESLKEMAAILETDIKDLKPELKKRRSLSFIPLTLVEKLDIKKAFALEELKSQLGNVVIQPSSIRTYPYNQLACHVLGYLNEIDRSRLKKLSDYGYKSQDLIGFGGIEEEYDKDLRQEEGGLSVEVDHRGRFVRALGFKPPINGKKVQLTLDLRLQQLAEKCLGERTGSIVVMDPQDGAIKAMVSSPGFNPGIFIDRSNQQLRRLLNNPDAPLINRAISSSYPAGSIFKIVVAAAALETGKINLSTTFTCPGSIKMGNLEFGCWNKHGPVNLLSAIKYSCNVFFYRVGLLVGAQIIHDYALKFGFSKPTGIDLPYENTGFVPSPLWKRFSKLKNWYDGDTLNLSIGQGDLLVTPLQVARMMAVFANKGVLVDPYIVKAIQDEKVPVSKGRTLNLKKTTLEYIRAGLKKVVSDQGATAHVLADLGVDVAGKTGTAQVGRDKEPHGWFAGFLPFAEPKFVICVFLEYGKTGYAASLVGKQLIADMLKEGFI
ncbi:MAG: penicillin-binding protein 2 [Candidatus Omnitrophota bacterium]|nr:MAG: penicillin-binding protein 2 [Candidatus Omnitrophota bacterium]